MNKFILIPKVLNKYLLNNTFYKIDKYSKTTKLTINNNIEKKSVSKKANNTNNKPKKAKKEIIRDTSFFEEILQNALSFQYLPHISKKIKATPEYIFHNVRELLQEYDNLQFLFVDGRKEMTRLMETIFASKCFYKKIDLQLAYDMKVL
jgi:hypothetical protein